MLLKRLSLETFVKNIRTRMLLKALRKNVAKKNRAEMLLKKTTAQRVRQKYS